ncbi:MAG: betaine/proline/choline family ABC transporter ATP-binding protein [Actinomycetia bacterium]|nr:betaine/proline/choline family ABC transporter ATP-binding protein [Actinomycetes bacterium]MCP4226781.1 betaine/proline/choline family ABC transporter ATP-binding protein [Actinomycetes bacterium]MCP5030161.1 betaine/proline/choline family ABC transporter ATP-binding protein [Actinomycetes bacterium]
MAAEGEEIIRLDNVYKIFGPQPRGRAFELVRAGIGKDEVLNRSGHVVGLNDVSFSINRGEIFVVMGLSGSGKSTAIRTVNKLHEVTSGEVWVDGTDVQTLSGPRLQAFRREKLGMVFQHFALFPHRNVIDNVGYGLKVQKVPKDQRDAAALKSLALVGLEPYAHYATHELSGGMQQRVGLARALASDPAILLMDEAFSALDPLIRRQMQDEMMEIQNQLRKTILFITHDLNEALRIGDRVCIMKDGMVVQVGTPEEILTKPATGYVAEFVQDVDQGRVIEVNEIMVTPQPVEVSVSLSDALADLGDRAGAFVVDAEGRPTSLLATGDAIRAFSADRSGSVATAVTTDFDQTTPSATLNEVYAAAGRGLPIAVVDPDSGKLLGNLDPRHIMEEMGRVETLIDGYEREVFM